MNLLEQYIVEIHSVGPCTEEWVKEFPDRVLLEVDLTTTSYGCTRREQRVFSTTEWEKVKEQGFYMA